MRICPKCQRTYANYVDFCYQDRTPIVSAELEAMLGKRFRIVRLLGEGNMSAVFLAEQTAVGNRPVALKILLRKLIGHPEFLLRFQNKAASISHVRHANVATIYEWGQADDDSPYIAMEYLEGESLRQALKRRGSFRVAECVDILQQGARGLSAAHKLGIIHGDLKPANIFLTRSDDKSVAPMPPSVKMLVKIVGFDIAKLPASTSVEFEDTDLEDILLARGSFGTLQYISP